MSIWNLAFCKGCRRKQCQTVQREIRQIFNKSVSGYLKNQACMYLLQSLIKQLWCLGNTRWAICKVVRLVCSPQAASSWVWPHNTSVVLPHVASPRDSVIFSVLYFLGSVLCQISKWHICNKGLIIIWFSNFVIAHSTVYGLLSFL